MAITMHDLEQRAALGWRAPEEERLGDWLLRAAGGFTGRANSALATGEPGLPLDCAAEAVRGWYRARRLPAMIAVPYPTARPHAAALDRFLAERGWAVRSGTATVMTARTDRILAALGSVPPVRVEVTAEPDEAWLARYHYRGQEELPPIALRVLTSAPWQAFASIRDGGQAIAVGRVGAAAGWAGLTAIEVDPARRRRGLARAVTAALAAQAGAHLAGQVYLQVEDDNAAARTLYRRIGFTDHHGYHYRVAPASPWPGTVKPAREGQERRSSTAGSERGDVMAVSAFQDYPLADRNREWDGGAAEKRIRAWAGAENEPNAKYRDAHVWYDSDNKDNFTAYKLLIADVIQGKVRAVPRAIMAAGNVMQGSRGGVDLPDKDIDRVKSHLAKYYKKMGEDAPWERG